MVEVKVALHSGIALLDEVANREGSQFEFMLDRALSLKRYMLAVAYYNADLPSRIQSHCKPASCGIQYYCIWLQA